MSSKRKRVSITLETKYKIIQLIDQKVSNEDILKKFRNEIRDTYNISKIKKNRKDIVSAYESSTSTKVKSLKTSKYPDIEKGLLEFILKCNTIGIPVNTLLLKEKANEFAIKLGYTEFKSSEGFISRFKKRNGVIFKTVHGEANGVSEDICSDWVNNKLPELIKDFKPEDVFNGDEFGLFWRMFPNKTYIIKGQKFKTGKKSKERISVFICANMSGTEKMKPIVIGKYKKPHCFRGKSIPVIYRNNPTSWMQTDIFTEFLTDFNRKMIKEDRKVALIIDNCPSHPFIALSNVKLIYLPPNTTSRLQPLDMGVIHSLKSLYRIKIVQKLLALIEQKSEPNPKDIKLIDALVMLKSSWAEVSEKTIQNCFAKSGFKLQTDDNETQNDDTIEETNDPFIWNELTNRMGLEGENFEDYVNSDNDIFTAAELSDDTIIENIVNSEEALDTDIVIENEEESDSESEDTEEPVKLNDVLNAFSQIRKYIFQCDSLESNLTVIDNLEKDIFNNRFNNTIQKKITDYFK